MKACPKAQLVSVAPKIVPLPVVPEIAPDLVDEYCDLGQLMKAWRPNVNPHAARFFQLETLILAHYEKAPKEAIIAKGTRYVLPVSARRMKRWAINLDRFFKTIGKARYIELCAPTLGAIEHEIRKDKRALYIAEDQTGNRTLGEPARADLSEMRLAA
jgi:hypothetical protein